MHLIPSNKSAKMQQEAFRSFEQMNMHKMKPNYKRQRISQNQTQSQADFDEVYHQFLGILNFRRQKCLRKQLNEYYGKNFPIEYKEQYGFKQGWENKIRKDLKKDEGVRGPSSFIELFVSFLTAVVYSFTVWITTINLFFFKDRLVPLYYQAYATSLVVTVVNIILRELRCEGTREGSLILKLIKRQSIQMAALLYFTVKLCGINDSHNIGLVSFQITILVLVYVKASKLYQQIRHNTFSLNYEYQTKVVDMIITIFIIAHFIAIVLYLTTHLSPENNWMTPLSIDHGDPFALYVYSFYFCSTTIMTVGYGDITPKHAGEVAAVVLVQIFGVIVLGYIINQIGYCVSALRRGQQTVEKDLAVVEKMRRHYRMDADLAHRVRQYVLDSRPNVHQLSPDEEQTIADRLNEDIRVDLAARNMLSVVKSSLFFLCRWSKQFQSAVSLRLTHTLFNPNDVLYQPFGNERIYIVKKGKVEVYAGKRLNKVLKTIDSEGEREVADNSYGITGVISVRKPKAYAVSKGFTSAYFIEGDKFKECVHERPFDFEFYHELKSKMDQAKQCQSVQIESLVSTKHHYNPTKRLVIRKYLKRVRRQKRKYMIRGQKDIFRGNHHLCDENTQQRIRNRLISSYPTLDEESTGNKMKIEGAPTIRQRSNFPSEGFHSLGSFFDHYFESSKEYSNFFARNNKLEILKEVEREISISSKSKQLHSEKMHKIQKMQEK